MTDTGTTFDSHDSQHNELEETNNEATMSTANQTSDAPQAQSSEPTSSPVVETENVSTESPEAVAPPAAESYEDAGAPTATESHEEPSPQAESEPLAQTENAEVTTVGTTGENTSEDTQATESTEGDESAEGIRKPRGRQTPKIPEEQMREIWSELGAKKNANEPVELQVVAVNRGGIVAQYQGMEVFVPVSHWSLDRRIGESGPLANVGDTFQAHILEITNFDTDARRVTATRRTLLRKDLMQSLEVGQRMHGRVASVLDFGAFIDLGGVDGLVHASEISYDRTKHPSELLKKGDEVDVIIKEVDREKKRIYLGMKELQPTPWEGVEEKFPVGTIQHGKVVGIGKGGAFIELAPGLEGFVRASELSWTKRVNNPKDILRRGMEIDVKVLDSSSERQRLGLSYRQAQEDPWPTLSEKFFEGSQWEGEVREISNKGVVVGVDEVEGFLPRGRMGRESRRLPDMKAGEKLNVHVIEVNPASRSVIFGLARPENEEGEMRDREDAPRGERERSDRRGGRSDRGGERQGRGERREGDGHRGERGDRNRFGGSVSAVNEMKSTDTVGSFALGDMLGEAIKKRLNYNDPEPEAPQNESSTENKPTTSVAETTKTSASETAMPTASPDPIQEVSVANDSSASVGPGSQEIESSTADVQQSAGVEQVDDASHQDQAVNEGIGTTDEGATSFLTSFDSAERSNPDEERGE